MARSWVGTEALRQTSSWTANGSPLAGDVKALLVATLGIAGSFALAWPIVTRTPLRRFL